MSEAASSTAGNEAPVTGPLKDFKDWLSPMLVKELRQGLRTRVFVMAFILLQAAMMVIMLASAGTGTAGQETTGALWFVAAIALLVAMPLRGFSSLSNEMRMSTMDLLTLTRLSAFRITFGKWAALYSQSLLLAVALMPYVVIRYFLGGIDLATELTVLFFLTLLSGVLTAVTVGFSAHPSILLRGAIVGVVGFFGVMIVGEFLDDVFRGGSPVTHDRFWLLVVSLTIFAVFASYYLLDMGASQFAPFAENHATRKRLAGLGFMVAMFACAWFGDDNTFSENLFALLAIAMGIVCVDALTEQPAPVPSVYAPFVRRGNLGRLFGRFFYPGWHTGLLYLLVVVAGLGIYGVLFDVDTITRGSNLTSIMTVLGQLLFPVVLLRLFFRNHAAPFAMYLLIQCITIPLVLLLLAIDDGEGFLWLACPIPLVQFCVNEHHRYGDLDLIVPLTFTAGYFVLLLFLSGKYHVETRVMERLAEDALDREGPVAEPDQEVATP